MHADADTEMENSILIYDQNNETRLMLAATIKGDGYTVLSAESESEALTLCENEVPFVVVTDYKGEGTNGLSFYRKLKEKNANANVFFTVRENDADKIPSLVREGVITFFFKPIEVHDLRYVLQKAYATLQMTEASLPTITDYTTREEKEVVIPNDLTVIGTVVQNLTLIPSCRLETANTLRTLLAGLIENAILYGNYRVTKEEVMVAYESNQFNLLIEDVLEEANAKKTRVRVTYRLTNEGATYIIADEGEGFEWEALFRQIEAKTYKTLPGRTIALAKAYFDSMTYDKNGSIVTIMKKFEG